MLLTKISLFPPKNLLITHSNLRSKLKGPRFVVKRTQNEESKIKKITFFSMPNFQYYLFGNCVKGSQNVRNDPKLLALQIIGP